MNLEHQDELHNYHTVQENILTIHWWNSLPFFIYKEGHSASSKIRVRHNHILIKVLWYLQESVFFSSFPSHLSAHLPKILRFLDKSSLLCRKLPACCSQLKPLKSSSSALWKTIHCIFSLSVSEMCLKCGTSYINRDNSLFLWSPFRDGAHKASTTQWSPNQIQHIRMKGSVYSIHCKLCVTKLKSFSQPLLQKREFALKYK